MKMPLWKCYLNAQSDLLSWIHQVQGIAVKQVPTTKKMKKVKAEPAAKEANQVV
jgi:hypothetical protein